MTTSSRHQLGQLEVEFKTYCFVTKIQVFLLKTSFVSVENVHILFNVRGLGFVNAQHCGPSSCS